MVCLFFREFIIDSLSVERNHVLVRINLIGGPMERILPPRLLEKVSGVKGGENVFRMHLKQGSQLK